MPEISVIVPVYNQEDYLNHALQCLTNQTLKDMEFICVNDGSTDQTGAAAQEYCAKFPGTFRLINKPNGGHGSGINCGIKLA